MEQAQLEQQEWLRMQQAAQQAQQQQQQQQQTVGQDANQTVDDDDEYDWHLLKFQVWLLEDL